MTNVVDKVNPKALTDYDTTIPYWGNDPDREANYRKGFLVEAHAAIKLAGGSKTLTEFLKGLRKREDAAQKLRWRAGNNAMSAARKRAGRKATQTTFTEEEQCLSRFCRGQMQSVATTRSGIEKLIERDKRPSIEAVRQLIESWFDHLLQWACCTAPDDKVSEVCPPFLHEIPEFRTAVNV